MRLRRQPSGPLSLGVGHTPAPFFAACCTRHRFACNDRENGGLSTTHLAVGELAELGRVTLNLVEIRCRRGDDYPSQHSNCADKSSDGENRDEVPKAEVRRSHGM